jgi:cytoskeletal protein RodZ
LERTLSFGRELQTERQRRDITLESIAENTKVPTRHLRALEQEQFEQLPGGVFNKGILRSYCRHLGLNEQEWLERFPAAQPANAPDWVAFAENVRRNRESRVSRLRGRWLGVLLMLLAVGAMAWAAWTYVLQPRLNSLPESGQNLSQPFAPRLPVGESNPHIPAT